MNAVKENSSAPLVTVLLPVHNAAAFLAQSMTSILSQSFTDFELLLINDGSTDESRKIIASFSDPRIRFLENPSNLGLIATLNRGIREARGKYIARMDADDVALPERLQLQVAKMESDPGIAVVAGFVDFINEDSEVTGQWNTDREALTENEIRSLMMRTNCIAHPTVLLRKEIAARFLYNPKQKGAEDWDLWMRILAAGLRIAKLPEVVLRYRVHPSSITGKDKIAESLEKRLMRVKRKFLFAQLAKFQINGFVMGVKISWLKNSARHWSSNVFPDWARDVKRYLSSPPWKVVAQKKEFHRVLSVYKGRHFFVFPYTHVGGAEKVHAEIVKTVSDEKPLVLFSAFSENRKFLSRFTAQAQVLDVAHYLNYPLTRKRAQDLLAGHINATQNAVFFGSNAGFFYDLIPQLSSSVKIIDLIHAFKYQAGANLSQQKILPLASRIDRRIFVSEAARKEFATFYFHHNIPARLAACLQLIPNAVAVTQEDIGAIHEPLAVLFVGRDSPEKRLHLFLQIAKTLHETLPGKFRFTVVGVAAANAEFPFVNFEGEITDDQKLDTIYRQHDFLLLTSSREGFPVVIMEAMAKGLAVIATPVGDIPNRLDGKNGIVLSSADEKEVVLQMTEELKKLSASPQVLLQLKTEAKAYAQKEFSEARFREAYRSLLEA